MSQTRSIELNMPALAPEKLGWFRYGRVAGGVVLTNDAGEWQNLSEEDFERLLEGKIERDDPLFPSLADKGFLREGADLNALAEKLARKKRYLGLGPHLAIVVTTLRCNQSCQYCHASRTDMDRVDTDMTLETAKKVVDMAMQTTNPYLCFEYQGGEPTVRMDIIKFMVEYSREKNKYEGKTLEHSLVTNMTYMTEENARWLIDNNVMVCTSLDGPQHVHDKNRAWRKGSGAYESVLKWMKWFNAEYVKMGRDPELWHVDALMTTTRRTLEHWKELIDLYVELGIRNIHLRPLNPFGFATKTWRAIGYTTDEFMGFYEQSLDYILELNKQGVQIQEGTAAIFLRKMLTPDDPNFVDLRNPVGSGTGQLTFHYDGGVYPSDEARMIAAAGDEMFRMGDVRSSTYEEVANHPTVRALAVASSLDSLPGCQNCWNVPFCGVRPLHNYMTSNDLFGQRPLTAKCQEHMSISRMLFERMSSDTSGELSAIFHRWTITRPRPES